MNITEDDLTRAAAPRSDQLNADDLMSGPRTVTITDVRRGNSEQPVELVTAEFGDGRPYRPGKSMIRVLISAWGTKAEDYKGRRLMIYRDPEITFGREKVGGIRISAMSHIDKRLVIPLTVTRGKRSPFVVEPLANPEPDYDAVEQWAAKHEKVDALQGALTRMQAVDTDRARAACAVIQARIDELTPPQDAA
ncbi:hypothetical protein [Williamsia serinedens]|uniref:Uncharacterized protein n=1 Tax=Williamsia serinedens TaxID=391736 RepID=A0ABT1HA38_9NOCA|nr:hypothetical protein [Williamsia serinedens]MCP2162683.1 hypothetical protein [Williamsia serinedens]